ncbi:MAG: ClbS/DfsB family four-helix bundle protein [Prevotellaceae bacterium]|jgi:hypothetical protein|nr:ClbS/DfsB family four-helix bundle protein [Prevotellaceae bacterium]
MARPTTKKQLLQLGNDNFNKLFSLINSMTKEEQEKSFSFDDRDKNIRDVLVHLYEWHQLLLNWIRTNQAGNSANFLPDPYNWKTYPQMNVGFWEKHQKTALTEAVSLLEESYVEVIKLANTFTDEELFTKKYFSWTGATNLGNYCVSAISSHYDWAIKKTKAHQKSFA